MSYESIAELVYEFVKNPKSVLSLEQSLPSAEFRSKELNIIQKICSEYKVSGDVMTIETLPLGFWG